MENLHLLIASDAARRRVGQGHEPSRKPPKPEAPRPRRERARAASAAALRHLAERLEPSPTV